MDKDTMDKVLAMVLNYAQQQIKSAEQADSIYLRNVRLSRAKGALEGIRALREVSPMWQVLYEQCDAKWGKFASIRGGDYSYYAYDGDGMAGDYGEDF